MTAVVPQIILLWVSKKCVLTIEIPTLQAQVDLNFYYIMQGLLCYYPHQLQQQQRICQLLFSILFLWVVFTVCVIQDMLMKYDMAASRWWWCCNVDLPLGIPKRTPHRVWYTQMYINTPHWQYKLIRLPVKPHDTSWLAKKMNFKKNTY